jgi:hypothetical protein
MPCIPDRHDYDMHRDLCWITVPDANLIARTPDTPRVMGDCDVFAIQDEVIDVLLNSVQQQQAIEAASNLYSTWSSLYRAGASTVPQSRATTFGTRSTV